MFTADDLINACMLDVYPGPAAQIDYGIDLNKKLYAVYQGKLRRGEITREQLILHAGEGKELTKLLGVPVTTVWDAMPDFAKED